MDNLKTKKKLYAGLGDYSRQLRMKQMGEKYGKKSTGNAQLDALSESQDATADAIQPPAFDLAAAVGEVGVDAGKWQEENEAALAEMADDEEDAKWMAKQRG